MYHTHTHTQEGGREGGRKSVAYTVEKSFSSSLRSKSLPRCVSTTWSEQDSQHHRMIINQI